MKTHALCLSLLLLGPGALAQESAPAAGVITGTIRDSQTGEPLPLAQVRLTDPVEAVVETDLEGVYRFEVLPGSYALRVWYDQYKGVDVRNLRVDAGATVRQDVRLELISETVVEELVIVGKVDRRSERGLITQRKLSANVSDAISAEEISRSPDSSSEDAVKRVVSATVSEEQGVSLRGLGGRYASTLVNGVALPSVDPDGHQLPLDMFPTAMLANLSVQKTYGAELSGAFAGGALSLDTRSHPDEFTATFKLSTGGDTVSTFRQRSDYAGGRLDFLGFDDGSRSLPASVPNDRPLQSAIDTVGADFSNDWNVTRSTALPNFGLSGAVGDTVRAFGGDLGYFASAQYGHAETRRRERPRRAMWGEGAVVPTADSLYNAVGNQRASLGALGTATWRKDATLELGALSLYTRASDNSALEITGYSEPDRANITTSRLRFQARDLWFNQLRGQHLLGEHQLTWQANYALSHVTEPDTRDLVRQQLEDGRTRMMTGPGSGERFFSTLWNHTAGASVEDAFQLGPVALKVGASSQLSLRDFDARRFRYTLLSSADPAVVYLPPEELFGAQNLGTNFRLDERTLQNDGYQGHLFIHGAFVTAEAQLLPSLRAIAGARVELSQQQLNAGSPYAITSTIPEGVDRTEVAVLPTANLIWAPAENHQLRLGGSYTVARPQFRELAPFLYFDFARRRSISGNPALELTRILNADARWEWFFGELDLLSAGVFYKQLEKPIELVVVTSTQGDVQYRNAQRADVAGVELEARVGMGRFLPALQPLRAGANLTLAYSQVQVEQGLQTSGRRPLQGQAPYVANVHLGWMNERTGTDVAVLYNVTGPRLAEVGFNTIPDVYERTFHRLDVAVTQQLSQGVKLKVSGENLLNQITLLEADDVAVQAYRTGVAFNASLEWTLP